MQLNNFCGIDVGCTNIKMLAVVNGIPMYSTVHSRDDFTRKELIFTITNFYNSFDTKFQGRCGLSINGEFFTGGQGFLGEIYGNLTVTENGNIVKIGRIIFILKFFLKL